MLQEVYEPRAPEIHYEEYNPPVIVHRRYRPVKHSQPKHRFHKQTIPSRNPLDDILKNETLHRKKEISYLYTPQRFRSLQPTESISSLGAAVPSAKFRLS